MADGGGKCVSEGASVKRAVTRFGADNTITTPPTRPPTTQSRRGRRRRQLPDWITGSEPQRRDAAGLRADADDVDNVSGPLSLNLGQ